MKLEIEIGRKEVKLISLSVLMAVGLAVAAQGAIQTHPISELVINQPLDLKDHGLKNVNWDNSDTGEGSGLNADTLRGQKPSQITSESGTLMSSRNLKWYHCADWGHDDNAQCSLSCESGETPIAKSYNLYSGSCSVESAPKNLDLSIPKGGIDQPVTVGSDFETVGGKDSEECVAATLVCAPEKQPEQEIIEEELSVDLNNPNYREDYSNHTVFIFPSNRRIWDGEVIVSGSEEFGGTATVEAIYKDGSTTSSSHDFGLDGHSEDWFSIPEDKFNQGEIQKINFSVSGTAHDASDYDTMDAKLKLDVRPK